MILREAFMSFSNNHSKDAHLPGQPLTFPKQNEVLPLGPHMRITVMGMGVT